MPLRLLATGIHLRYLPKQHIPPRLPMGSKRSPTQSRLDVPHPPLANQRISTSETLSIFATEGFCLFKIHKILPYFFFIVNYYKTTAYEEPQVNNNHSTFYSKIFKLPACSNDNFKEGLVWVNLPPVKISEKPFFKIIEKMIKKPTLFLKPANKKNEKCTFNIFNISRCNIKTLVNSSRLLPIQAICMYLLLYYMKIRVINK